MKVEKPLRQFDPILRLMAEWGDYLPDEIIIQINDKLVHYSVSHKQKTKYNHQGEKI